MPFGHSRASPASEVLLYCSGGALSLARSSPPSSPPPLHSNHAHTVQGADARLFMESRCRVPANTNSAQHSPNYRQHARDRSFCESLEMRGWPHRISLDEFCNFPIFRYHGAFSEVEHDNRAGGCHISWRISRSKLKGSSPLHAEGRNIDRDRVRGLESRPRSLLPLSSIFRSGAYRAMLERLFLLAFTLANCSFQGRSPSCAVAVRGRFN